MKLSVDTSYCLLRDKYISRCNIIYPLSISNQSAMEAYTSYAAPYSDGSSSH